MQSESSTRTVFIPRCGIHSLIERQFDQSVSRNDLSFGVQNQPIFKFQTTLRKIKKDL